MKHLLPLVVTLALLAGCTNPGTNPAPSTQPIDLKTSIDTRVAIARAFIVLVKDPGPEREKLLDKLDRVKALEDKVQAAEELGRLFIDLEAQGVAVPAEVKAGATTQPAVK